MNFFVGSCILNRSFPFGLSCWPSEVNHAHACLIGAMMIRRWCLRCCYDSWKEWHRHQQYRWASATSLCIANCIGAKRSEAVGIESSSFQQIGHGSFVQQQAATRTFLHWNTDHASFFCELCHSRAGGVVVLAKLST